MMTEGEDLVKVGDYVVIQRQDYFKLVKVAANSTVQLGKDTLYYSSIIGNSVWLTYRMDQKKSRQRDYELKECKPNDQYDDSLSLQNLTSGSDNRNIVDDSSSQKLSMEEIVSLRDEGLSSKAIVGTLIENSKTFHSKTEYSQQKYLKKKEKKYFEYITVRKPSLRLIAEIMFRHQHIKIMGLRMDTLSQIVTALNLHSHGTYLLYESGCQGLAAAALLNGLCGNGRLILAHPGNIPQKHALLALNPSTEQENCLTTVNIYQLLRKVRAMKDAKVGEATVKKELQNNCVTDGTDGSQNNSLKQDKSVIEDSKNIAILDGKATEVSEESSVDLKNDENAGGSDSSHAEETGEGLEEPVGKRKHCESGDQVEESEKKRPRSEIETERAAKTEFQTSQAAEALLSKADGLVLVCKEHPGTILRAFLPFVAPSHNFVVYCQIREPLQELLVELKQRQDVINLRLTDTWVRNYQVQTDRTHPLVNMAGSGGYLLTGVAVEEMCK